MELMAHFQIRSFGPQYPPLRHVYPLDATCTAPHRTVRPTPLLLMQHCFKPLYTSTSNPASLTTTLAKNEVNNVVDVPFLVQLALGVGVEYVLVALEAAMVEDERYSRCRQAEAGLEINAGDKGIVAVLSSHSRNCGEDKHGAEKDGITLTWENLWVTVPNGKDRLPILQGLTGYAQPGKLLAIMGPSGCGKSTLLDALAGRLSSGVKQTGKILINGHKQALAYGTSGYVTQDDAMLSNLTAGETLYYSAQLQFPDSMSTAEKKEQADITLREMGLQDAINTRVGGWSSKGLSGGQKRRLSICIEILTGPRLLFLDEATSGLDSAASYYVMRRIASLSLRDGIQRTIVTSIHQPSSEVFELFHDLCLLSSGETVYFGLASDAKQFFASNGFPCPTLHNPSDHFLRIINKDFDHDPEEGFGIGVTAEVAIDILVKSYGSSEIRNQVQNVVAKISESNSGAIGKKRIHAAFLTQCLVLIRRSSLRLFRDMSNYWLLLAVFIAVAISMGSMFHNLGSSNGSIQGRGSLITFLLSTLTFMTLVGGFAPLIEEMKVFELERLNGHYGITAFLISNIFSAVPYVLMISLIPGGIVYYLSGLHKGLEHFVYFASVLFAIVLWVESLMMVVGSMFPNFVMGMSIVGGVQGLTILTGGFYRLPNDLPKPFWKYPFYYISFLKYAFQGSFKNEFEGSTFAMGQGEDAKTISGREILTNIWQVEMGHSKWVDLAIMFGMIVLSRVVFLAITKSKEKLKPTVASNGPQTKVFTRGTRISDQLSPIPEGHSTMASHHHILE